MSLVTWGLGRNKGRCAILVTGGLGTWKVVRRELGRALRRGRRWEEEWLERLKREDEELFMAVSAMLASILKVLR